MSERNYILVQNDSQENTDLRLPFSLSSNLTSQAYYIACAISTEKNRQQFDYSPENNIKKVG
jgi:hypothetical protein